MRKWPTVLVCGLAAATLTGCSGHGEHGNTVRGAAVISSASPGQADVKAAPLPSKIPNRPGVRKDVVQTGCTAIPGGWAAQGTATNPGAKPVTYKIIVFFTTTKATTLDYAQTLVPVKPGKTVPWKAAKRFRTQGRMLCPMPGISVVS